MARKTAGYMLETIHISNVEGIKNSVGDFKKEVVVLTQGVYNNYVAGGMDAEVAKREVSEIGHKAVTDYMQVLIYENPVMAGIVLDDSDIIKVLSEGGNFGKLSKELDSELTSERFKRKSTRQEMLDKGVLSFAAESHSLREIEGFVKENDLSINAENYLRGNNSFPKVSRTKDESPQTAVYEKKRYLELVARAVEDGSNMTSEELEEFYKAGFSASFTKKEIEDNLEAFEEITATAYSTGKRDKLTVGYVAVMAHFESTKLSLGKEKLEGNRKEREKQKQEAIGQLDKNNDAHEATITSLYIENLKKQATNYVNQETNKREKLGLFELKNLSEREQKRVFRIAQKDTIAEYDAGIIAQSTDIYQEDILDLLRDPKKNMAEFISNYGRDATDRVLNNGKKT